MFAILEVHLDNKIIGFIMEEDGGGEILYFDTKEEAEKYAKENCAFDYQIIEV